MAQHTRSFALSYSIVALVAIGVSPACGKQELSNVAEPEPAYAPADVVLIRDSAAAPRAIDDRADDGEPAALQQKVLAEEVTTEPLAARVEPIAALPSAEGAAKAPAPAAKPFVLGASSGPGKRVNKSSAQVEAIPKTKSALEQLEVAIDKDEVARVQTPDADKNTERYAHTTEQPFTLATGNPLSTFSIDVDTASYSNIRRLINNGQDVDPDAVRVEEMVNYFDYEYSEPKASQPFSVVTEVTHAPWATEHQLVMVGLQGRHVAATALPPRNLVFLLDVSGSMDDENKLPLLKRSFAKLLDTLGKRDRVAIVVYAGASGLVLPSTPASDRATIEAALERLAAGGSTNGAAGIELAYEIAERHAVAGGINRVILATDGDFNVGTTSESALTELIEQKRERGVSLTVLGFGMGNYNDSTLERLADNGNGNYAYIDTLEEAQKVLVTEASATMFTIAKDVKVQVEWNPAVVGAYRLIGYDNRRLADRDFNDDRKDAGEIGAGHSVTALYEVLTPAQAAHLSGVDALVYQSVTTKGHTGEMFTVKLRYKHPDAKNSQLLTVPVANDTVPLERASANLRFASAVAAFGMYLRQSEYGGSAGPALALQLARSAIGSDQHGYRKEFVQLVSTVAGGVQKP